MKRNPDLIRHILLMVEAKDDPGKWTKAPYFVNEQWADEPEIEYHLKLLIEAGYLKGSTQSANNVSTTTVTRMTWDGCDFLDAARDDKRWAQAKDIMGRAGGATFEVLKAVLVEMAGQTAHTLLGLHHKS